MPVWSETFDCASKTHHPYVGRLHSLLVDEMGKATASHSLSCLFPIPAFMITLELALAWMILR